MPITDYHAKYYANALFHSATGSRLEQLTGTLADAQVDLNPHQIEAALFAMRSPFSKGVIMGDEVGLGKTIEALIVIAQKWAEGRRKILIIVPANLKIQWQNELNEKFYLPSVILDGDSYKAFIKAGIKNPFAQDEKAVICSYNFAYENAGQMGEVGWDLVVMDEAHKVRNAYTKFREDEVVRYTAVIPAYEIKKKVVGGFEKACHTAYKFDSVPEHEFSVVLERSKIVEKWLRPASGQFKIHWQGGQLYKPDFVVETADSIYIVEIKAYNRSDDTEVCATPD